MKNVIRYLDSCLLQFLNARLIPHGGQPLPEISVEITSYAQPPVVCLFAKTKDKHVFLCLKMSYVKIKVEYITRLISKS